MVNGKFCYIKYDKSNNKLILGIALTKANFYDKNFYEYYPHQFTRNQNY